MTDSPSSEPQLPILPRIWVAVLLVTVFAVYAPSLGNGFALDDRLVVKTTLPSGEPNRMTAEVRPLSEYFTSGYWAGNPGERNSLYRPITILSYALTNAAFGETPLPHHLFNLLLHVWATWLALQILRRLLARGSTLPLLLGASVFGLHAIHSEVVAGIVGRAELFGFCFGAQALLWFLSGRDRTGGGRITRWAGSGTLLLLAICSKESALAWAPFLWIVGIAADRVHRPDTRLVQTACHTALVVVLPIAVFFALRHQAISSAPPPDPVHFLSNQLFHEDTTTRILTGFSIWGFGLWKCVWPTGLCSDYGPVMFEMIDSLGDYRVWLSLVCLLGLLGIGLKRWKHDPLLFVGMAGFLGFSFLVSNVPFAIGTIFGERLYYTPSFGIVCLLVWVATRIEKPLLTMAPLAIWLAVSGYVILDRNGAWANPESLMLKEATDHPRNLRNQHEYARHLLRNGRPEDAAKLWELIIEIDPQCVNAVSDLGSFLAANGEHQRAEALFLDSLKIPLTRRPLHHITHLHLSRLYEDMKRPKDSIAQLRLAWTHDSAFEMPDENLLDRSQVEFPPNEMTKIIDRGEKECAEHPTWPLQRGNVALNLKDFVAAVTHLERAHQLRPQHILTRWMLSIALMAAGRKSDALPYLRGLRSDPATPAGILSEVERALK